MSIAGITPQAFGVTSGFGHWPVYGVAQQIPHTDTTQAAGAVANAINGLAGVSGVSGTGGVTGTDAVSALGGATSAGGATGDVASSFGQILASKINDLDGLQKTSDTLARKAVTGDLQDIHEYTIAANEANVATQLTVAVRNKAVEAFNEIMRMQM